MNPRTLTVSRLGYRYPSGRDVLRDLDLTASAGEITAIIGQSGSGKSTLLACLGGLLTPTSGRVVVQGGRESFAIVTQGAPLFDNITVWENVALAWGYPRRALRAHALEVLESFGISAVADSLPRGISFGQRQRVAIAAAVASDSPAILADEPTGGLDPENSTRVGLALRTAATSGRIVIAVTHDESIEAIAHHVLRLEAGTLTVGGAA